MPLQKIQNRTMLITTHIYGAYLFEEWHDLQKPLPYHIQWFVALFNTVQYKRWNVVYFHFHILIIARFVTQPWTYNFTLPIIITKMRVLRLACLYEQYNELGIEMIDEKKHAYILNIVSHDNASVASGIKCALVYRDIKFYWNIGLSSYLVK